MAQRLDPEPERFRATIAGTTEGPITATVTGLGGLSIVPEPGTLALVMLGLTALRVRSGRRR